MRVLILGSGGREHALAWKIAQSSLLDELFIAPGNVGTKQCGTNIDIKISDFRAVKNAVLQHAIDLVVVGSEELLVAGIHDFFLKDTQLEHVHIIGPQKDAARLESSKDFAKQFMYEHGIPTAQYQSFSEETIDQGIAFLERLSPPYVLKADGLAAGKGVLIIESLQEAIEELEQMLRGKKFGKASETVVIEEFLSGEEFSMFVLTDGESYKILPEAKDYKRIGEGDIGLNTGGMGAVSPVPFVHPILFQKVEEQIIIPTIRGLQQDGIPYRGFIFFGLIKVGNNPFVIEYNCRLGDPETQVILPRLKSDLLDLFEGLVSSTLSERDVVFDPRSVATVVMASDGYPQKYRKGKTITGLENANLNLVFHAGTSRTDNNIVTAGGRVLAVSAYGQTLQQAVEHAYQDVQKIHFNKAYFRKDIGKDVLKN